MKTKVLHLLSSNSYSGAENVVCHIIDMFKDEIDMAYCSPIGTIKESLDEKNIDYLPLEKVSYIELKKVISSYKPDIIHAHDIRASVIAAQFSKKVPIISHLHGKFEEMTKLSVKSILYRLCIYRFRHIFAVSQSIIKDYYFSHTLAKKGSVLYNVVNEQALIELVKNEPKYNFDFIFLGRFSYPKNPKRLIKIIAMIVTRMPNATFVLIGSGNLLEETKLLAKELNVYKNITFTGYVKNPYPYLKSSKVMLMTSRTEGTPMCVLEAMLFGIPVISTAIDGIKEIIDHGSNGYYFYTDDEIVNQAIQLINNEELRKTKSIEVYKKGKVINNMESYRDKLFKIYRNNFFLNNEIKR
ncbi:hypothetical protein BLX88_09400 [Bacillus obstructivus]|uniref:Glycosyltransferase n=1 Tax=Heyndrickxia oleronia TaxID=38875 RepID=A0AAW6SMH8_9BACI|nr:glycosyltransferase [Heyndrickxia oleronia]MDH5159348.1 glycosyltransferase [Heyndrickxia oleronia]OJH19389.1 hypothetical protein BLX88_09400 [Bacillus obstructivus]